jgi:hypothetical protein
MRIVRKLFALVAAAGLIASVWLYFRSFSGTTLDSLGLNVLVLHTGIFVLVVPIFIAEYSASNRGSFSWDKFAQGKPNWVAPAIQFLGVCFLAHFVLFAIQSHLTGPAVRNGQYVLESHGRIVRAITRAEYVKLKGAELRIFVTAWMFFYFVTTVYWWFPRTPAGERDKASAASPTTR